MYLFLIIQPLLSLKQNQMSHVIAALIIFHLRPPTSALPLHPLQNLLGVTLEPLNT